MSVNREILIEGSRGSSPVSSKKFSFQFFKAKHFLDLSVSHFLVRFILGSNPTEEEIYLPIRNNGLSQFQGIGIW